MRVEKRPDKLAADVFQPKLEVRVLVNRVMPAIESGRADVQPLFVRDLLGLNEPRGITGARGGDS